MKKGEVLEGIIERVEYPNRGILFMEDKRVTIKDVLPGQKVSFMVGKVKKNRVEGRLLEVLERSPAEADSMCPHFPRCGGCTYQNLPYEEQLNLKREQLKNLMDGLYERRGEETENSYIFEGIKKNPQPSEYRNKMEFSFGDTFKGGPLALGLHKKGSFYDIVTTTDCQIVDSDYRIILSKVLQYCEDRELNFYHKQSRVGYLRHLLIRKARRTGEILAAIVTTSQEEHDFSLLVKELLELQGQNRGTGQLQGSFAGILHIKNNSLSDVVKSDETDILYGRDYFYEEILGMRFKISPFSFFQTNSLGAEVLYETVREYIGDLNQGGMKKNVVFDLYSGTGTIAQMLAPVAEKVVGVEIVEEAVLAAKENAVLNGISNVEFIAGDVLKVLDSLEDKPDVIVLDPPREGVHPRALEKIISYQVDKIVYISCKPTSLVRDLEVFLDRGYEVRRCVGVDMFSGTVHVETVCCLTRIK